MRPHPIGRALIAALLALAGTALTESAAAQEAKAPASVLLNILSAPVEPREAAFDQFLREDGPPPPGPRGGVVQPDGSVRYGNVTVSVGPPCLPASHVGPPLVGPPPLPGRRAR